MDSLNRREMLNRFGMGMGMLALAPMISEAGAESTTDKSAANPNQQALNRAPSAGSTLQPKQPHFQAKAKRLVHLFMNGGPSHVDSFDYKPILKKYAGQPLPGPSLRTERKTGGALPSPFPFKPRGQSGLMISDLFEHTAQHADELCVINSMHADVPNHEPSLMLMNCGDARQVRPAMGSWVLYGLGTENQNLPGFVVLCPTGYPIAESQNWHSGFMPGIYQGTYIDPSRPRIEDLIENVVNHRVRPADQRRMLDVAQGLNRIHAQARADDPKLSARIQSLELAFRMQTEATDAFDVEQEPASIREAYGPGNFARQMIMTRRLLERGVRCVQVWTGAGQPWDHHDQIEQNHGQLARQVDRPIAAFLTDLKQRGMLDETLVVWGGEFGRTPVVEMPNPSNVNGKAGRDHNHWGFTMWMAGGGVKGGYKYGATDEAGFKAVEKPVHVHDLHATILHLLGFNHEKLTYRHAGRDFRLTDIHGNVIKDLIA